MGNLEDDLKTIKRLSEKLHTRALLVSDMRARVSGRPPLPMPDNERPNFERLRQFSPLNLAELIVEARLHRMQLNGAKTAVDNSANGDDVVNGFFYEQDMKRKLMVACRDMLVTGSGYLALDENANVLVPDPFHTVVETDAFGNTTAALTAYRDNANERDVLMLVMPGYIRYAYRDGVGSYLPGAMKYWSFLSNMWEFAEQEPTNIDSVTVYELSTLDGLSLLWKHLPTLDRIDHGILQRLIIIAVQAFKQRALKDAPDRDEAGNEINYDGLFESGPDALWLLPEGVEIWESSNVNLEPVLSAVKDDIRFLAVESKTPLYMISPDDANGSAEGATAQRETLIFDVEAHIASIDTAVRRFLADAMKLRKETERADLAKIRLLWENPRRSSISERASAAQQATAAGIPLRTVMELFAEMKPDQVEDAIQARTEDTFNSVVANA